MIMSVRPDLKTSHNLGGVMLKFLFHFWAGLGHATCPFGLDPCLIVGDLLYAPTIKTL